MRLGTGLRLDPALVFRAVLIGGLLTTLAANLPGQLSVDAVMQLYEGRFHVRDTWAPAVYAMILGGFDQVLPGTGLYLAASSALLFGSLLFLRTLRPGMSWFGPVAAAVCVLSPALLIYQGIVWKDVLFANLAIASFVLLAHAARVWTHPGRPWLALLAVVVMLAVGAQVRQNGLIAAGPAALVLAWTARREGWKASLGWCLGLLVGVILTSVAIGMAAQPQGSGPDRARSIGIGILQHYDLIGASAHDPSIRFGDIQAVAPEVERAIRTRGVAVYSPERVDYLDLDPVVARALWQLPPGVVDHQWRDVVMHHTGPYLAHRWDVFKWVLMTPMIDSCIPVFIGVDGPAPKLKKLGLAAGPDPTDQSLYNYGTWLFDTPVFSHLTYVLICAAVAVIALLRHDPQDVAMAGLMVAALGFVGSFFVISIACDYRYLYFVDLAALTGLIYLAIDPPWPRAWRGRP